MASYQLYLTGSHYFGGATPDSDIDFYAEHSLEFEEYLKARGFVRLERNYRATCKPNLICVYQHPVWKIDIQLVADVTVRPKIHRNIIKYGMQPILKDKRAAFILWQFATDVALEN
jgi:hypothetical protein